MTRWEYLRSFFTAPKARPTRVRHRSGEKAKRWAWSYSGMGGIVEGHTRSHARSAIKANLGIRKGRVPMGTAIDCLG